MSRIPFCFLIAMSLVFASCNDNDDDNGGPSGSTPPATRTEKSTFTLNGQAQPETANLTVSYQSDPQALEIVSEFSGNNVLSEFAMAPIRSEGSHTSNQTIGFAVVLNDQAWFCNEGCTVVILEHDSDDRWVDISISGQMQDLFGTTSATLNSARISAFY